MTSSNEMPLPGDRQFESLDEFFTRLTGAPLGNADAPPIKADDPEVGFPYMRMMDYMQRCMRAEGSTVDGSQLWPDPLWTELSDGRTVATQTLPWLERAMLAQMSMLEQATGMPYVATVMHLHSIGAVLGYMAGRGWLAGWLAEERERNA